MQYSTKLSRRERQIMDSLYARGKATVNEVRGDLPDPPTDKAVRRMLEILEEKGHVKRRKEGREFVYRPTQSKKKAGESALKHVLETFFGGALDQAFAVHLDSKTTEITQEELDRLSRLIEEARQKGN